MKLSHELSKNVFSVNYISTNKNSQLTWQNLKLLCNIKVKFSHLVFNRMALKKHIHLFSYGYHFPCKVNQYCLLSTIEHSTLASSSDKVFSLKIAPYQYFSTESLTVCVKSYEINLISSGCWWLLLRYKLLSFSICFPFSLLI